VSEFETIRYETNDALAAITLARPEKRNAVNHEMFTELGQAADRAASDPEVRAVLLRGDGPSFCSGLDLSALGDLAGMTGARFRSFLRLAQRPFLVLSRMAKPAVAAVQGHALGAGFQLALACDLRVAAGDATFGMLEARYGLIPDLGGSHHLARLVGPARAKELVWTTRPVPAEEAMRIGLVNRVVFTSNLAQEAEQLCRDVMAYSPTAAASTKSLISRAAETAFETELEREADAQAACLEGDDHRESVAAFLEGRTPQFGT